MKEKPRSYRASLLENLPSNKCSYSSIFDAFNGMNSLAKLNIKLSEAADLLPALKRKAPSYARYSKALLTTQAIVQSNYKIKL